MPELVNGAEDPAFHGDALPRVNDDGGAAVSGPHGEAEEAISTDWAAEHLDPKVLEQAADIAHGLVTDAGNSPDFGCRGDRVVTAHQLLEFPICCLPGNGLDINVIIQPAGHVIQDFLAGPESLRKRTAVRGRASVTRSLRETPLARAMAKSVLTFGIARPVS